MTGDSARAADVGRSNWGVVVERREAGGRGKIEAVGIGKAWSNCAKRRCGRGSVVVESGRGVSEVAERCSRRLGGVNNFLRTIISWWCAWKVGAGGCLRMGVEQGVVCAETRVKVGSCR